MKIDQLNTIRISGAPGQHDSLREMKTGSELPVRILERTGPREAVLDIAGRRVHAEFLKGVPQAESILLKLDGIKDNSFIFKMVNPPGKEEALRRMLEHTIFSASDIPKNALYSLTSLFSKHPPGIFELNALILGSLTRMGKKEDRPDRLLNMLLKRGAGMDAVSGLAYLRNGMIPHFGSLLSLLGQDTGMQGWTEATPERINDLLDRILTAVTGNTPDGERDDLIRRLIDYLTFPRKDSRDFQEGELAYPHDSEFRPFRYIGKEDSWIFSIEFTALGRIDLLAKKTDKSYSLSIFCAEAATQDALNETLNDLKKKIASVHPNIYINLYYMPNILNKMVEINSYYSTNSVFDIKV